MAWAASGFSGTAGVAAGVLGSLLGPDTSGNSAARDANLAAAGVNMGKAGTVGDSLSTIGTNQQANYQQNFAPLEGQLGTLAQNAGSVDMQNKSAGLATAGVDQSFANAQGEMQRNLSRNGAAPGSGVSLAMGQDMAIAKAKAEAGAGTMAKQNEFDRGVALKSSVLNQAQGLNGVRTLASAGNTFNGVANTGIGLANANQNVVDAGNKQSAGLSAGLGSIVAGAFKK